MWNACPGPTLVQVAPAVRSTCRTPLPHDELWRLLASPCRRHHRRVGRRDRHVADLETSALSKIGASRRPPLVVFTHLRRLLRTRSTGFDSDHREIVDAARHDRRPISPELSGGKPPSCRGRRPRRRRASPPTDSAARCGHGRGPRAGLEPAAGPTGEPRGRATGRRRRPTGSDRETAETYLGLREEKRETRERHGGAGGGSIAEWGWGLGTRDWGLGAGAGGWIGIL